MRSIPYSRLYIASGGPRKKFTATVVINLFVSYSFWKTLWGPPIKSPSCKQFTQKMNFWQFFKYWAHSFLKHVAVTCHKIIHSYSGHQPIWIIFVLEEPLAPPYFLPKFDLIHPNPEFLAHVYIWGLFRIAVYIWQVVVREKNLQLQWSSTYLYHICFWKPLGTPL